MKSRYKRHEFHLFSAIKILKNIYQKLKKKSIRNNKFPCHEAVKKQRPLSEGITGTPQDIQRQTSHTSQLNKLYLKIRS